MDIKLEMENLEQQKIAYEVLNNKARYNLSEMEVARKDILADSIIKCQSRIIDELLSQWINYFLDKISTDCPFMYM